MPATMEVVDETPLGRDDSLEGPYALFGGGRAHVQFTPAVTRSKTGTLRPRAPEQPAPAATPPAIALEDSTLVRSPQSQPTLPP